MAPCNCTEEISTPLQQKFLQDPEDSRAGEKEKCITVLKGSSASQFIFEMRQAVRKCNYLMYFTKNIPLYEVRRAVSQGHSQLKNTSKSSPRLKQR